MDKPFCFFREASWLKGRPSSVVRHGGPLDRKRKEEKERRIREEREEEERIKRQKEIERKRIEEEQKRIKEREVTKSYCSVTVHFKNTTTLSVAAAKLAH
jgi:hypothetical protein